MGPGSLQLITLGELIPAEALPVVMQFAAAGGVGIGLILWLAGQRMVRGMFAVLGLVVGGGTGFFLSAGIGISEIAHVPTPLIGLVAGALVGLLASVMLYRAFMAVGSAAVLGIAAVLGAGVMTLQPATHADPAAAVALTPSQMLLPGVRDTTDDPDAGTEQSETNGSSRDETLRNISDTINDLSRSLKNDEDVAKIRAMSDQATSKAMDFGRAVLNEADLVWDELTASQRASITLWGFLGVGLGFLLGLAMPGRSSMLVTSVLGAGLWLPCSLWLGSSMNVSQWVPQWDRLAQQPVMFWVATWIALSLFGFVAQWVISPKHKQHRKSAHASRDDSWDEDE